jgi:uncharacterized membrane protein HdeD (DUF308 family)
LKVSSLTAVQIGLGILIIIFSVITFFFLASSSFLPVNVEIAIVLFFVGIQKVITGAYTYGRYKWLSIGPGILVIIFAYVPLSLHGPSEYRIIVFLAISIFVSGAAQIVDGIRKESKWSKRFIIGVGAQTIGTSVFIISVPTLGVAWAGQSAAITLLVGGIQTLVSALGIGKRIRIKR